MSDRAKIRARRVTGNDAQQQREIAMAIKNAREMALLPYTNRVTQQRRPRPWRRGGDRGGRACRWAAADAAGCRPPAVDDVVDEDARRRRCWPRRADDGR